MEAKPGSASTAHSHQTKLPHAVTDQQFSAIGGSLFARCNNMPQFIIEQVLPLPQTCINIFYFCYFEAEKFITQSLEETRSQRIERVRFYYYATIVIGELSPDDPAQMCSTHSGCVVLSLQPHSGSCCRQLEGVTRDNQELITMTRRCWL